MNGDIRDEFGLDRYESLRREFVFHMTDWVDDLDTLAEMFKYPGDHNADGTCIQLIGILYHVIPHLRAAARLLLREEVPDPFLPPANHLPVAGP
jgi:hypothetical protein